MMKKILKIILCSLLLTGCTKPQEDTTVDTKHKEETIDLQVVFGLHNIETGYIYEGGEMSINFDYEISNRDSELGLMIFINGIPQNLKGKNDEGLVYHTTGKKDEKVTDTVTLIPNTGMTGEILSLQGALIADCEVVDDIKSLANKQHVCLCGETKIQFNADSTNNAKEDKTDITYEPFNLDIIKRFENKDADYFNNNLLIEFPKHAEGSYKKGDNIEMNVFGAPGTYRVWILENLVPAQSYYMELSSGQLAKMNITLEHETTKNIKALALPLDNNMIVGESQELVRE